MGDGSDITAGGAAPVEGKGTAPAKQGGAMAAWRWVRLWAGRIWRWIRSWVERHWRGELSLPVSYWINPAVASVMLYGVVWLAREAGVNHADLPRTFTAVWVAGWATGIWVLVGVWRSAGRYTGHPIWAFLARLMMVLSVLEVVSRFVPPDLPSLD